jgi:hypothetical protein
MYINHRYKWRGFMKNTFILMLLCTTTGLIYSCETEVADTPVVAHSTQTPAHIVTWKKRSLALLNKQATEVNIRAMILWSLTDPKTKFSIKDIPVRLARRGMRSLARSNFQTDLGKEKEIRKRIRITWQHIEPAQVNASQLNSNRQQNGSTNQRQNKNQQQQRQNKNRAKL